MSAKKSPSQTSHGVVLLYPALLENVHKSLTWTSLLLTAATQETDLIILYHSSAIDSINRVGGD